MATLQDLAERIDRLLLRHQELERTNQLLQQQLTGVSSERDSLKSRLTAARSRIDALLERLPAKNRSRNGERRMKQMEVTILGQSYVLACPDGGEALAARPRWPASTREMSAIRDAGKVKARERIAVLAALNLAYQLADRAERAAPRGRTTAAPDGRADRHDAGPHRCRPGQRRPSVVAVECSSSAAFARALYFLEPMLFEQGLGTLQGGCDRLASDEPETLLTSPT